jgi:hypothetical protein
MALVYENGKESYRNLAINGKATKKNIEDLSGSWSTGEFGSVLADYSRPPRRGFRVPQGIPLGRARVPGLRLFGGARAFPLADHGGLATDQPPYTGSVWVDKETHRVLRIEMQATHIPDAFPIDKVEMATDYEFVRFAERQYLVPVHAESLGCQRDTNTCSATPSTSATTTGTRANPASRLISKRRRGGWSGHHGAHEVVRLPPPAVENPTVVLCAQGLPDDGRRVRLQVDGHAARVQAQPLA